MRTNHSKLKPNLFSVSVSPFGNTDVDKYEAQLAHSFLLYSQPTPHPQAILGARSLFSLLTTTSPPTIPNKKPPVKPTQWLPLKILKDWALSWFHIICNWEEAECMMRARWVPTEAGARRAEARYGCQLPLSIWAMMFFYNASNVWILGNLPFPPILCLYVSCSYLVTESLWCTLCHTHPFASLSHPHRRSLSSSCCLSHRFTLRRLLFAALPAPLHIVFFSVNILPTSSYLTQKQQP